MPVKRECHYQKCPVEAALDMIGGKWRTMIVAMLLEEDLRFNELQRRMNGISHKVLTEQLRDLANCGIVHREEVPQVPPKVVYSLTPLGHSLQPLILELRNWGEQFALAHTPDQN